MRRHHRIRKEVVGGGDRPRLSVFRSNRHLYAQIINDLEGRTLVAVSTLDQECRSAAGKGTTVETAKQLGSLLARRALSAAITQVVFDRGGYRYHGQVKALAEGAREGGLRF